MTGTIDTNAKVSDQQKAVINKYGFVVTDVEGGRFKVTDEAMYKAYALKDASKKGPHTGKTLDEALQKAVAVRKDHEAGKVKPVSEVSFKSADVNDALKNGATLAEATRSAIAKGKAAKGKATKTAPVPKADTAPVAEKKAAKGKAEKKERKPREKAERKDNRYLRASKVIVENLGINAEDLAKKASMSVPTASHCLEAWAGITKVLLEKKWLKFPAAK